MDISIIIPTRNGKKHLEMLFIKLKEQTIKPKQILIMDSSSDDNTGIFCKNLGAEIIKIDPKSFDHGGTRKLAASKAKGEVMVFLTQDTIFKDSYCLENLITPLKEEVIAASYARQIPKNDANPIEVFVRHFNYPLERIIKGIDDLPRLGIKTFFFSNVCSAIKRRHYEEVGGFPEKTIMNEDMFLAAKLLIKGYKIIYQPEAAVYHSHNYSLGRQFKRYFDIGVFFSRNKWIKNMVRSEREGMKYLKEEIRFLFENGWKAWIPYALADTAARFVGYRMGVMEKMIPISLKKMLSLNKLFWESETSFD